MKKKIVILGVGILVFGLLIMGYKYFPKEMGREVIVDEKIKVPYKFHKYWVVEKEEGTTYIITIEPEEFEIWFFIFREDQYARWINGGYFAPKNVKKKTVETWTVPDNDTYYIVLNHVTSNTPNNVYLKIEKFPSKEIKPSIPYKTVGYLVSISGFLIIVYGFLKK